MSATVHVTHPLHIGTIVRDRRRALGLRREDLAEAAGLGRNWLGRMESGRDGIRISHMLRVLAALDIDCVLVLRDDPVPCVPPRLKKQRISVRKLKGEAKPFGLGQI